MPGSGKTTIGRQLAARLKVRFIDLDTEIEAGAGRTIPEIFAEDGEETFRKLEQEALAAVAKRSIDFVLAAGGGTPCFFDNLSLLKGLGVTVYLQAPAALLVERTKDSRQRPLLQNNHTQTIAELLQVREKYYQQAHLSIAVAGKSPDMIVDDILGRLNL